MSSITFALLRDFYLLLGGAFIHDDKDDDDDTYTTPVGRPGLQPRAA